MQGTLFFVHGTGVRQEGYDRTIQAVQGEAGRILEVKVIGCPWGPKLGVSADKVSLTLPPEVRTKGVTGEPPSEAELAVASWALLTDDPLFELRLVASSTGNAPTEVVVNAPRPDQTAIKMLDDLRKADPDLTVTGVTPEDFRSAVTTVRDSDELQAAARAVGGIDPILIEAVARAVTAQILAIHRLDAPGTEPVIAVSGDVRDKFVERLQATMSPARTKGAVINWLKDRVLGFASSGATAIILSRRQGLTSGNTPPIGDIIYYQRRGKDIADLVANQIKEVKANDANRPIVAVGHSLGGIILVDLLSRDKDAYDAVDLLVTAGSQSPLFFAIDSLETLRPSASGQRLFKPWLNIYNRSDFLSFCAKPIFGPDDDRIWDESVDPGVPFPASHGAYWQHDRTYELIKSHWPSWAK